MSGQPAGITVMTGLPFTTPPSWAGLTDEQRLTLTRMLDIYPRVELLWYRAFGDVVVEVYAFPTSYREVVTRAGKRII